MGVGLLLLTIAVSPCFGGASHQFDLSNRETRTPSNIGGIIPGVGRGAILGQQGLGQQNQLGQQQQLRNQMAVQQIAQLQGMTGSNKGQGGMSSNRTKADKPLEILKENSKYYSEANKRTADAFKQMQQAFNQSLDKLKPPPDNAKITEGLAEDQQKLAEANAKAPPVGAEIVKDLIKGINDHGNTKAGIIAQQGAQMAPPSPTVFQQSEPRKSIGERLRELVDTGQLRQSNTRSTFAAGDTLTGGTQDAIPRLQGQRSGPNNIGHAFTSSVRSK